MAKLIKCRDCGAMVSRRARACLRCGRAPGPRRFSLFRTLVVGAALGMAWLFVSAASGVRPGGPGAATASVVVERPGAAGHAHLCDTRDTLAALRSATVGEFGEMRDAGRIVIVPNGARAAVVESSADASRVRVETGPRAGAVGWVAAEYLRAE